MRGPVLVSILMSVLTVLDPVSSLECRVCSKKLSSRACNEIACPIDCPAEQCACDGLCHTTIKRQPDYVFIYAACTNQYCNHSRVQRKEDLFSKQQIQGFCTQDALDLRCECASDSCNNVSQYLSDEVFVRSTTLPAMTSAKPDTSDTVSIVIGTVTGTIILLAVICIACCVRRRNRLKEEEFEAKLASGSRLSSDDASLIGDGPWDESGKHSFSCRYSSSTATQYTRGSRGNAMNHNDHHLPIELQKIIGRGRFAEVWKAKLQQDCTKPQVVSVKVFRLRNYGAWRQEKDMLAERWMRHENLIEFYASEQHTVNSKLQYWLVTAYYEQGSLAQYLRSHKLDWFQFCDMALSIAKGLSYLHEERDDTGRMKIPIAHRDIKSSNILVKDNCNSCVLADFGLSLKLDPQMSRDELSNAGQVGTSRYMAPELLERLVNLTDIEMFKRIDVYALALVLWEMANRCEYDEGTASPYTPPFGDQITDHPTKQQMLVLVCRERQKPDIPNKWMQHKGLLMFIDILNESWEYEAEARITAGTIYERFLRLRQLYVIDDVGHVNEAKMREERENEVNKRNEIISTVV